MGSSTTKNGGGTDGSKKNETGSSATQKGGGSEGSEGKGTGSKGNETNSSENAMITDSIQLSSADPKGDGNTNTTTPGLIKNLNGTGGSINGQK